MLEQNWSQSHPVRLIGINLSGFHEEGCLSQPSLFDQMESNSVKDKSKQIDEVMDKIRSKHGTETITFATLVKREKGGKG